MDICLCLLKSHLEIIDACKKSEDTFYFYEKRILESNKCTDEILSLLMSEREQINLRIARQEEEFKHLLKICETIMNMKIEL
jgi:hypothetical protein